MYNQEPVLPIDIEMMITVPECLVDTTCVGKGKLSEEFDYDTFSLVLEKMMEIRDAVHINVASNIHATQAKEKNMPRGKAQFESKLPRC